MKTSVVTLSLLVIIAFFIVIAENTILNHQYTQKATATIHCTYNYHVNAVKSKYNESTPEERKYAAFWISLMLDRPCENSKSPEIIETNTPRQAATCNKQITAG
ncbi:hypothetical protein [Marinigracilibium pacificum]|uniref:Uncharacterized protein n=1 Tax=Marinigracilibium pacificum TaxID=2729599 RepID=A0A848J6F0_9BACT|nr:hypothetical protein [Marinigracilibium pacificum]NMM48702.1 hypothetical protein [Marinigracilibium pacificum]